MMTLGCSGEAVKIIAHKIFFIFMTFIWSSVFGCSGNAILATGAVFHWGDHYESFLRDWSTRGSGFRDGGINNPETVNIKKNTITIRPYYDGRWISAGAASTYGRFTITGPATISAKLSVCLKAPLRTAIWLQSPDNRVIRGIIQQGREIDIAEIYTSRVVTGGGHVAHNIHFGGYDSYHKLIAGPRNAIDPCAMHTYSIRLSYSGYKFYIDGNMKWAVDSPYNGSKEYLIFSVEVPRSVRPRFAAGEALGYARLSDVQVRVP